MEGLAGGLGPDGGGVRRRGTVLSRSERDHLRPARPRDAGGHAGAEGGHAPAVLVGGPGAMARPGEPPRAVPLHRRHLPAAAHAGGPDPHVRRGGSPGTD